MAVANARQQNAEDLVAHIAQAAAESAVQNGKKPVSARLADHHAVSADNPVHRLQAGLAQLTTPAEAGAEGLYPGWFRLAFPVATSAVLWGAILLGVRALV